MRRGKRSGASVPDVESSEVPFRIVPNDLDGLHPRVRLRGFVPFDARLDRGPVALEHRFDVSVRKISHVSVEAEAFRPLDTVGAKVNALDLPLEDDDCAGPQRSAEVGPPERTLLYALPLSATPTAVFQ